MIKEYQISNFKPFNGAATIPIKPITLIFGANSSGKSSILQSLLMLKQTLENAGNPSTVLLPKGHLVDLGSFKEFIHGHDQTKSFSFKMTFDAPEDLWEAADDILDIDTDNEIELLEKVIQKSNISLEMTFDNIDSNSIVSRVALFLGSDLNPIVTYEIGDKNKGGGHNYIFKGNFDHPYWRIYWELFDKNNITNIKDLLSYEITAEGILEAFKKLGSTEREIAFPLLKKLGLLPEGLSREETEGEKEQNKTEKSKIENNVEQRESEELDEEIKNFSFERATKSYRNIYRDYNLSLEWFLPSDINNLDLKYFSHSIFRDSGWGNRDISLFMLTLSNMIKRFLQQLSYLAPLRKYPERYYIYGGNQVQNIGASGEMVPDILFCNQQALFKVNEELKRFTGKTYELRISRLSDERSESSEIFSLQLIDTATSVSANIRDIGFGFSQVLPIIVQTLTAERKTLLIEQPELHLHPALQAELGDLFINAALGEQKNTFIIETHSEHLILRLLRRIRETSEGKLTDSVLPITPEQISVLYIQSGKDGAQIMNLEVTEDGDFMDPWPDGFFTEREKELF